jgi:hypothetical protein
VSGFAFLSQLGCALTFALEVKLEKFETEAKIRLEAKKKPDFT